MPFPGLLPVPWPSLNLLKVPLKPPDFKNGIKCGTNLEASGPGENIGAL